MKLKTTKKAMRDSKKDIVSIGYCELQTLLDDSNAFAYSAGISGWACDYFEVDNVIISTGYNPIGRSIDYKIVTKYEKRAKVIRYNSDETWTTKEKKLSRLLSKFIKEIK